MTFEIREEEHLTEDLASLRMAVRCLEYGNVRRKGLLRPLSDPDDKYRTIFENTGTATLLVNEDATVEMASAEFRKMTGCSEAEILGRSSWIDFIAPEDKRIASRYHAMIRMPDHSVPRNYECRVVTRSGERRTCFMTSALFPGTRKSILSFMDITDTFRVTEAAGETGERFSKAFRASPDGIVIATLKGGRFIEVNDTFLKMTGYDREETIGHTASELSLWPDRRYEASLMRTLLKEGHLQNQEVSFPMKSGEMRVGMLSAEVVDLDGEACLLSAVTDITEQVRLEKEILRISDRERMKIGHDLHDDLGQHLIGIEALASLLHGRLSDKKSPEAYLGEEIAALVRQAIRKTRAIARGLCPVTLEEGGLRTAIRDFVAHINKVFGVRCLFNCDRDAYIADESMATNLYHIVQESVNNAIRHGRATEVVICLKQTKGGLFLSVRDNGAGIPQGEFRREGMGLNIMAYRARRIGATLDVRRKTDGGTEVLCILNRKF